MEKHGPQAFVRDAVAAASGAATAPAVRHTAPRVQPVPTSAPRPRPTPTLVLRRSDPLRDWNGWATLSKDAQPGVDAEGYIYADGVAENPVHWQQMQRAYAALHTHFWGRDDVSVQADVNLHFRRGDRRAFLAPDVMVTFGELRPPIASHRVWEQGVPSLVVEVLSERTWDNDLGPKKREYERIGVAEYVLYDPWGTWLPERLLMFHLVDGVYLERRPLGPTEVVDDDGAVREVARIAHSEAVGLDFLDFDGELRLRDPATGQLLRTQHEWKTKALAEEVRADAQQQRADREAEGKRRERQRADREAEARRNAEARVAELEKMLRARTPGGGATPPPDHEQDHPAAAETEPGTTRKR